MNRDVARVEKDLLFDISIVHSANINDRIEWVLGNVNSKWLIPYIAVTSPKSIVITPPYLVVSSLPVSGASGFPKEKRTVYCVDLCDNVESVKNTIQYLLTEHEVSHLLQVDLFIYNGKYYEKTVYNIGACSGSFAATSENAQIKNIDSFITECDKSLEKKLYEDCFWMDDEEDYKRAFVEIPNLWEICYTDIKNKVGKNEYFILKTTDAVIDEAAIRMFEENVDTVLVENSWYKMMLYASEELFDKTDDCLNELTAYERFKNGLKVTIELKNGSEVL